MAVCFMDPARGKQIRDVINGDAEFKLAGRLFTKSLLFKVGEAKCLFRAEDGNLKEIMLNPTVSNPWDLRVEGSNEAWEKFLQPIPPPFFSDVYGMINRRNFDVGGDTEAFFTHFWAINRLLNLLRQLQNGQE